MNRNKVPQTSEDPTQTISRLTSNKPVGRIRHLLRYLGNLAISRDIRYAGKCLQADKLLAQRNEAEAQNRELRDQLTRTEHLLQEQAYEKTNLEKIIYREHDTTFEMVKVAGAKVIVGVHQATPIKASVVLFVPSISDRAVASIAMTMESLNFCLEHISINEQYAHGGLEQELIGGAIRYCQKKGARSLTGNFSKYEDGALPWEPHFRANGFVTAVDGGLRVKVSLVSALDVVSGS